MARRTAKKRHSTFADNVRRAFLGYALLPLALLMAVFFVFFIIASRSSVVSKTHRAGESAAVALEAELVRLEEATVRLAASPEAAAQLRRSGPYNALFDLFYEINQGAQVRVSMHLLDGSGNWRVQSAPLAAESRQYFDLFILPRAQRAEGVFASAEGLVYEDRSRAAYLYAAPIEGGGTLVLCLEEEGLLDCIEVMDNEVAIVADEYDNVVLATGRMLVNRFGKVDARVLAADGEVDMEGARIAVSVVELPAVGLRVYAANTLGDTATMLRPLLLFTLVLAGLFTVLVLFLAQRISRITSASVEQMIEGVNAAGEGQLDFRVDIQTDDEFQILGERFNEMQRQISTLIRHNSELTDLQWEAEVKQLESQFAPHFVFNVLETLRYSVDDDPKVSRVIIESLSRLLKYSVYSPHKSERLAKESEYITEFLTLHQLRSGGKIRFAIEVPRALETALVPKLLLQPLVENSVKHGYNSRGRLDLRITARREGDNLRLRVEDDGGGAEESALQPILAAIETGEPPSEHIGLFNLHRKLYLIYGTGYGLHIENHPGEGFCVEALLPLQLDAADEAL